MRTLKFMLAILSSMVFTISTFASDFPTVMEYIEKNNMNDKYHQSSVAARCAGVLGAYARYLPKKTMSKEKEAIFNRAMTMLSHAAIKLHEKGQVSQEKALQQVQRDFEVYMDLYYQQIEFEQIRSGSIMGGKIGQDFESCNHLAK